MVDMVQSIHRDIEEFYIRVHDLIFAEGFIPLHELSKKDIYEGKIKIFPNEASLNKWAAKRVVKFIRGSNLIPDMWYVRKAPSKYDPCTISEAVDRYLLSCSVPK